MGWKAFAQCGIYMVEYEMLENSSGYTDKYKICKSITYKEGIKKGGTQAMKILVTGGAGYIGSHTCVELLEAGYDVVTMQARRQLTGSDRSQARRRHFMRQISGIMRK